ncbi:MAG: glycosyltransferase family 4 protein [Bacteroidales bacterium]|jgi:glycosyltransferase involved in cell wall biosynthesis|nr:glycosyltransferase family 4 protein [Bacteroidales bacterium]
MHQKKRIRTLFLSAWYPNREDAMVGLFVRKHAEAVALQNDVTVLYLHADPQISKFEIIKQNINEHLHEIIVYYPNHIRGTVGKFFKIINYFRANRLGNREVKKDFRPDIVHVNVLTRTGLLAYWLKLTQGIPYVITEHWSRYFSDRNSYHGFFRKVLTKLIVKSASAVLPVSEGLKKAMKSHKLHNPNYQVVNNVVDDFFFEKINQPAHNKIKQILHVSCFDDQVKNISGILRATKSLSLIRNDFNLVIVGTGPDYDKIKSYADDLKFPQDMILFTGELTPKEVATQFHQADFFVLFSNYENSPVVISESLASGKPVISTDVGGIAEHVNQTNGILIPVGDENALLNAILHMLENHQSYDAENTQGIAKQKFSYKSVSNEINKIYSDIIYEV